MDYAELARNNEILKVRVGSNLFGTNTPDSDTDYEGIFMPSEELVFGLGACREVDLGKICKDETNRNTRDAIDYKTREYRDFCRLALQNNPNILNILFVDEKNILFENDFGTRLREVRHLFPHRGCIDRFLGYAHSQRYKLGIKPENYSSLESAARILGACSSINPGEILVEVVPRYPNPVVFKDLGPGKHIQVGDLFLERGSKISQALSIIRRRLDQASSRAELWKKFGYDTKFASNLIQILMEGIEIVKTGELSFPLAEAGIILAIKNGSYSLADMQRMADNLEYELRTAIDISPLPSKPRRDEVEQFIIQEVKAWFRGREAI